MKRLSEAPREEPSRLSERATGTSGTFVKTALHETRSASDAYFSALVRVDERIPCTDMRDLLRLLPEIFDGVVKIEIDIAKKGSEPIQINALVAEDRVYFTGSSDRNEPFSRKVVPLVLEHGQEEACIGQMHVLGFKPISLGPNPNDAAETEKILKKVAGLVAKTIDATLDGLTVLPIRKYFDRSLAEKTERFSAEGRNFSLIIIDLDRFKRINDEFGHPAGDRVLAETAMVLMNGIRGRAGCIDTLFRTGGEEFAVLLSDVSTEEAAKIADRLRMGVKAHDFQLKEPSGAPRPVTCSVGVADAREAAGSEDLATALYKLADSRLLRAKEGGRDSVVSMKAIKLEGE